ncbi:MAG: sodium:alanine symporter family protein [Candidatus Neomarinimicrobiota bacterium]|jgi:AGCS family alanine or glycine:cation symporter|nr:sodium:alanine symporter family protein [Candidatus Neomarinimicrobiota bacterium]MEC8705842.1 sodium:alanine symporter family protein [Candidatus Neomarinimicrobiota bacterium]|tara:strand:+ start:519 stop:2069 length:1551 start_codon:yes stop_codon:yes gene_type:complete
MSKRNGALIFFGAVILLLSVFGVSFFEAIWSFPRFSLVPLMVVALLGTGIFTTINLGFPQIKYLKHGLRVTRGDFDNPNEAGDLNHFQALTTALSATVGIGNIAGVATAIYYGGPGALFWMWITAFFGSALKFAECTLAVEYRDFNSKGMTAGGPMYTIEKGLGKQWRWLAIIFAGFAVICSFATGNAIQSFTLSDQLYSEVSQVVGTEHFLTVKHQITDWYSVSVQQIINGLFIAGIAALVIIGGIKRIGSVTSYLAPFMAAVYVVSAILILLANITDVPASFGKIISMAFNPPAAVGGVAGGTLIVFMNTLLWGVKRGLYSNEAGQGSAPIAHSTAKTEYPVREGVVALLEPFIDTIIICTLTGLTIISTGAWQHTEFYVSRIDPSFTGEILNGSLLTSFAFKEGLSWLMPYGDKIITIGVLLFAISTVISWSFYGDRSTEYLFGEKAIPVYRVFYITFVFIGAIATLEAMWAFGDAALGFMTFPNLISIIMLSGVLKKMTNEYFSMEHKVYKK